MPTNAQRLAKIEARQHAASPQTSGEANRLAARQMLEHPAALEGLRLIDLATDSPSGFRDTLPAEIPADGFGLPRLKPGWLEIIGNEIARSPFAKQLAGVPTKLAALAASGRPETPKPLAQSIEEPMQWPY